MKWGEHSSDVQFILQWAPLDNAAKSPGAKSPETPTTPQPFGRGTTNGSATPEGTLNSPSGYPPGSLTNSMSRSASSPFSSGKPLSSEASSPCGSLPGDGGMTNKKNVMRGQLPPNSRDGRMSSSSGSESSNSPFIPKYG